MHNFLMAQGEIEDEWGGLDSTATTKVTTATSLLVTTKVTKAAG